MGTQAVNGAIKTLVPPIDWGFSFALSNKRRLLLLTLLPAFFELLLGYYEYNHSLEDHQAIILFVVGRLVDAWLVTAVLMLAIHVARDEKPKLIKVIFGALSNLPKVFFSYVVSVLLILIGLQAYIIPGLLFVGFLIWAPAFCAGEIFVPSKKKQKKDDEAEPELDEADALEKSRLRILSYFKDKFVWELGLARSWRMAGKSFRTAYQLAGLFVFATFMPVALVDLLTMDSLGFSGEALKLVISAYAGAIVKAIWAGTFVMLIPGDAKREIGITSYRDPLTLGLKPRKTVPRFEGRPLMHFALAMAAGFSVWIALSTQLRRTEIPHDVSIQVEDATNKGGTVEISLSLYDPGKEFRWLYADQFRMQVLSVEKTKSADPSNVALPDAVPAAPTPQAGAQRMLASSRVDGPAMIEPKTVRVFDEQGQILNRARVGPYRGNVKITLIFDLSPEYPQQGDFQLYYASFIGFGEPVARGAYGEGW